MSGGEITAKNEGIRYAQCWEDADVLLQGLAVRPGDTCLSICSAGDNTLALLVRSPARVHAIDVNPAQLACLEIRMAAMRSLDHAEFLELYGARPSRRRGELYRRCRGAIASETARQFWEDRRGLVAARGFGAAGRMERYLSMFRRIVLPLIHRRSAVNELLRAKTPEQRLQFYRARWDGWRWRLLFRLFFSRFVMGRLGRTRAFFDYAQGSVAEHLIARTRHALTTLDPSQNPYLFWILTGGHGAALPLALRPEHYDPIRNSLDRIVLHRETVEDFVAARPACAAAIDRANLSDIFEYMSQRNQRDLLERLCSRMTSGGRLAYWNMMVPRSRPECLGHRLAPVAGADELHAADKAFFYRRFVVEQVV